ncbi:MAG: pyrroline-5-carboxylate reductase [Gammaproteobacteria bacterium]|nr:pyrroline-5-carboxylate reductase [Gammaproteobacteria bacterium]NNF61015.1 pyrroline-5-carboxylate reductase [Gammaproteobacteria bacterium]NNM21071.1 pyrroline-5-carboxylate reductase [Gammaproteobacteria bacterium]
MSATNICFIGAGNMARSLIGGLIADGSDPASLCAADPDPDQRDVLQQTFGVRTAATNAAAAAMADVIVLAVKPQVLAAVASELAAADCNDKLIVSIAAGIREPDIRRWLGGKPAIVRAMPNTPALLRSGATALYANAHTSEQQREIAESLLRAVGAVVWLDDETLMDAVTAVSGSGPAYFFLFMEVIARSATELGLPADIARLLTVETALGAARMALETGEDIEVLRHRVTSPGGTTAAALATLDSAELRNLISTAIRAARDRGIELADEFGQE